MTGARDALAMLLADAVAVDGRDRALGHWVAGAVAALTVMADQEVAGSPRSASSL